jgi:hypothetical protein
MSSNNGQNRQQKQSGGYQYGSKTPSKTPRSKSRRSTKRRSSSRSGTKYPYPFQNQANLQRIMALFQ